MALRRVAQGVTLDLKHFGITFDRRVPLSVVEDLGNPTTVGLTSSVVRVHGGLRSVDTKIQVRKGLSDEELGAVLAHEGGHAWMHQSGIALGDLTLDEGFCNWVAVSWLRYQGTKTHLLLAEQYMRNPDPVYGGGLRTVVERAEEFGGRKLLRHVVQFGSLPEPRAKGSR